MSQYPYFEVLSYAEPEQREKWRSIVKCFEGIDVFYYPEYVYLFEIKGDGKAHCFVYYDEKGIVIFPFLVRKINELAVFSDISDNMIDISSPYGYGGYLRNNDQIDMENFYKIFKNYCHENNVISEFVRFHPLIDNFSYAPTDVTSHRVNETVVLDLSLTQDDIWKNLTSSCRNKITKSRKLEVKIAEDESSENIDKFYELYQDTMLRLRAYEYYSFSLEWFHELAQLLRGNVALFHAKNENKIILSSFFLFNERYIHYYLSGSDFRMSHMAANNLLLYEVALWAKNRNIKYFHLGGGLQAEDSLFRFKASFSPLRTPFLIGNVIHNNAYYYYLCARRSVTEGTTLSDSQYFPGYRAPIKDISPYSIPEGGTVIIGASGHARVCSDILIAQEKSIIGFSDDDSNLVGSLLYDYQVLGRINEIIPLLLENEIEYVIAIGDNDNRKKIATLLKKFLRQLPLNVIHPSAIISPRTVMGHGNFIAPGVIINTDTVIGSYTIINTGATVDHDNIIHDFAQISPGCNLAGNVTIEEGAFLGTGVVVIPGKTIGAHAVVGAGAVVIQDIPPFSTAVGVPARVIKQRPDPGK